MFNMHMHSISIFRVEIAKIGHFFIGVEVNIEQFSYI